MTEALEWKPIPSVPGYEASTDGRIRHGRRVLAELEAGLGETVTCIEFMQHEVTLWEPGEERQFKAALARARALLEPKPNLPPYGGRE